MVVEPVGRARIAVQPRDMIAEPDTGIGKVVGVACLRVRTMLIDRRRPVNGDAAHYQAREEQNVQPMAHSHQQVVLADKTDARRRGNYDSTHIVSSLHFLVWGTGAETTRMLLVASSPFGCFMVTA